MKRVSAEEFCRIWESSSSLEEVATKLGARTKTALSVRAVKYRKLGVPLKSFTQGVKGVDVESLKQIVMKIKTNGEVKNG